MKEKKKKKISIVLFSGNFDTAVAAFTIAAGAAAFNYEVHIFFTFWGFNTIKKKKGWAFVGKGLMARLFNFLMGGRNKLPLSKLNFAGLSPVLMTNLMKKKNVATLDELVDAAIQLGVNMYACEMSMHIFGMTLDDFVPEVNEVLGVTKFLDLAEDGQIIFI